MCSRYYILRLDDTSSGAAMVQLPYFGNIKYIDASLHPDPLKISFNFIQY